MKLVFQYVVVFLNFLTTSSHLHPLQVENCDSNSRFVVDEDDYGKVRLERVKVLTFIVFNENLVLNRFYTYRQSVCSNVKDIENTSPNSDTNTLTDTNSTTFEVRIY